MIVNEISIIELEMLSNMGKQLAKARSLSNFSTAVFGGLLIIIVMGYFYHFLPIAGHLLWGKPQIKKDHNSKILWLFFTLVITLTQQMRQDSNLISQQLLRRVRIGALTQADVSILNEKIVTGLTLSDLLNNIVIVQCNKIKHLISRLQIERFTRFVGHDIVIFPAQHSHTKRE